MAQRKVCIIGGGISGLISAKILLEDNDRFDVVLFEKSHEFGGVWSTSRAYAGLCSNNAKHTFGFSDVPIPESFDEYPTAAQMLGYFTSYAKKYDVYRRMVFDTEVIHAKEITSGCEEKWEITTRSHGKESIEVFDLLVIATGLFHIPHRPTIPEESKFGGKIFHSSSVCDANLVRDKKVLIIGNGKSAADMVSLCGEVAKDALMIFRKAHWIIPRYIGGVMSTRYAFYGRWYRYILPYYSLGPVETFRQSIFKPFIKIFWAIVQFGTVQDMKVPKDSPLIPDTSMLNDTSTGIAPPGYYESIHAGKVRCAKTEVARFLPGTKTVEFTNGNQEDFDVVIFATGYCQGFPFFDAATQEKLQIPGSSQTGRYMDSPYRLYRSIVPINGPRNIGFIGFQSSIANGTMYEVQANWLAEYFLGHISLPDEAERQKDVNNYLMFEKRVYPAMQGTGASIFIHYVHMIESLLSDMKVSTTRTSNFIHEYLLPVFPTRFQIRQEKVRQRKSSPLASPFYFSFSLLVVLFVIFALIMRKLID